MRVAVQPQIHRRPYQFRHVRHESRRSQIVRIAFRQRAPVRRMMGDDDRLARERRRQLRFQPCTAVPVQRDRVGRREIPFRLARCRMQRRIVRPGHLDQSLEIEHHAQRGVDRGGHVGFVPAEQRKIAPERRAQHAEALGGIDVDAVVQVMHVVERMRRVAHRRLQRAEFPVVVLVVARHVDHRHRRVERLGGPAQAFRVVVDVAGQHDEIRIGVRDRVGQVAFEVQVGQDADFHGLGSGVGGFSAGPCRDSSGRAGRARSSACASASFRPATCSVARRRSSTGRCRAPR